MSRKSAKSKRLTRPPATWTWLAVGVLALTVLAVFAPTFHSGFVYDSQGEIVLWDYLHDPKNLLAAVSFRLMSLDVLDFNRPVAVAWLMFNSLFWNRDPVGYHVASVLLHVVTTGLVFVLIRHFLERTPSTNPSRRTFTALLGTLVFALHPLVTEAVCEPSNCKDLLATLFGVGAILLAARHRPGWGPGDPARVLLVPFLCLLSIGSKELGAAFPAILLAYWLLFRRKEPARFWILIIAGSAAAAVLFLIARFALAHHPSQIFLGDPVYPGGTFRATLFLVQPRIFELYLINLVWPLRLCADYNAYSIRPLSLMGSYLALTLVAAGLAWWSLKDRRAAFATAFIGATLLPVANLVPIYHPVADRYLYAPLIGIALLAAVALDAPWLARRPWRYGIPAAAVLILLGLSVPITLQREHVWSSEIALWQDTLERNPASFSARTNLPEVLLDAGRLQEARAQSEATLASPYNKWPWVWSTYAIELDELGDRAGAEKAARQAIALKPDITDADKMARTLQADRENTEKLDRIVVRFSPPASSVSSGK